MYKIMQNQKSIKFWIYHNKECNENQKFSYKSGFSYFHIFQIYFYIFRT